MFQTSRWIKCSDVIGIDYLLTKSPSSSIKLDYWNIFWLGQKFCDEFIAKINTCYTVHKLNLIKCCLDLGAWMGC